VFFDTLKHRETSPRTGMSSKCLRGGPSQRSGLCEQSGCPWWAHVLLGACESNRPRHGRGMPQGGKAQESQGRRLSEKSATARPNRQREKTPEARPRGQQCLCAESATYQRSRRDRPHGLSDEHVLVTASPGEVRGESRPSDCLMRSVANRRRGCCAERRERSLSGKALKGIAP